MCAGTCTRTTKAAVRGGRPRSRSIAQSDSKRATKTVRHNGTRPRSPWSPKIESKMSCCVDASVTPSWAGRRDTTSDLRSCAKEGAVRRRDGEPHCRLHRCTAYVRRQHSTYEKPLRGGRGVGGGGRRPIDWCDAGLKCAKVRLGCAPTTGAVPPGPSRRRLSRSQSGRRRFRRY